MARLSYREALNQAMSEEMAKDPTIFAYQGRTFPSSLPQRSCASLPPPRASRARSAAF
jgi:hypothetical protein